MQAQDADGHIALGIDVGGTFTDILAFDRRKAVIISAFKIPSTPANPASAAIQGTDRFLDRIGLTVEAVYHGTTVGTNALIEKRGGRTALITTKGFRDVLALRRQARPRLYDLEPVISPPLVARDFSIEADERMNPDGSVARALTPAEIQRVVERLAALGVDTVAVSLLHSYASDRHERMLGAAIAAALPEVFVSLSCDVCREFREFERTSTTVVNAYIGPVVSHYVDSFNDELASRGIRSLSIVKSNGGLTSAANARRFPVHLIESGPAAGIIAAAALGRAEGYDDLIAFDMGGTTAKAGVIRAQQPKLSTEFYADQFVDGVDVGGYPIKSPVIDIIEIGAGGGSIARVDSAGVVKVGPESASADPGPACYGRGGEQPTITDVHVAIGHIDADGLGSEDLHILAERATAAINQHIARPLGWSVPQAAWGVLRLANAHMAEMVRLATLRRGLDPRDFALVAFGGAGPLHAAEIAREVGVPKVIIPPYPGLFSAIGTVLGDIRHDLVQTLLRLTPEVTPSEITEGFKGLERRAGDLIAAEDTDGPETWSFERFVDLRFEGQLFEITLPVPEDQDPTGRGLDRAFRAAYRKAYGYDLERHVVELVNLRLVARTAIWSGGWPRIAEPAKESLRAERTRAVYDPEGDVREVVVVARASLQPGAAFKGPMIIEDFGSTIRVLDGQTVTVKSSGVLEIAD